MIEQILLHDVGEHVDKFLFSGRKGKKPNGVFGTMIWEQLELLNSMTMVSKTFHEKYKKDNVKNICEGRDVVGELRQDLQKRVTKTDSIEKYRLTQTQLNGDVPYITKRNPWYAHQPPIRLYKNIDLIRACYRRHTTHKGYLEYNNQILVKREEKFYKQLYRMKYIWCIIKVIQMKDTGHYDHDYLTETINLKDTDWKGVSHYIEYGTIMGLRNYTQQELRQINVIDWLFYDLDGIFYKHIDLLKKCKEHIKLPTSFEDDMEVRHLRQFIRHRELYVCLPTLTEPNGNTLPLYYDDLLSH